MAKLFANSGDADQSRILHCLPITFLQVSRLQWVKENWYCSSMEPTLYSKLFLIHSEKGVYSKTKEFAPLRSRFFPFRLDPFLKRIGVKENKQEVTEVVSLVRNGGKSTKCILPGSMVQSVEHLTADSGVISSNPSSATYFHGDWSWNNFSGEILSFLPAD